MKNIASQIAGLATLALGALPVAALSTAVHAQSLAPQYAHESVRIGDLDLATTSSNLQLAQRN